jgi:hypothetical protein
MSTKTTPLSRALMSIAAVFLFGASVALTVFGFTVLREDATDLCHLFGSSFEFSPDTRWLGFATLIVIASAYLFAKAFNKPTGLVLSILVALWGIALIIVPSLA